MQKSCNVPGQTVLGAIVMLCFRRLSAVVWLTEQADVVQSDGRLAILPHGLKTEITTTAVSSPICMLPKIRALEFAV